MGYGYQPETTDPIDSEIKRSRISTLISIAILVILVVGYSLWHSRDADTMKIQWTETELSITDPKGQTFVLNLNELEKLSYQPGWDFGSPVQGGDNNFYRYGIWENSKIGSYRLYAAKECTGVILLESASEPIAISYETDKVTQELYEALIPMLNELGYSVQTEPISD